MKDKERYTVNRAVRLTPTQANKLDKLEATVRDAVVFYIDRNENPKLKLIDRKRDLENLIYTKKMELNRLERELDDINKELGTTTELEETLSLDIILDGNKIIDSYQSWSNGGTFSIDDYLINNHCKRALNHCILEHGGDNKAEYEKQLLKYIKDNCNK